MWSLLILEHKYPNLEVVEEANWVELIHGTTCILFPFSLNIDLERPIIGCLSRVEMLLFEIFLFKIVGICFC
jgi:hypothetical protein